MENLARSKLRSGVAVTMNRGHSSVSAIIRFYTGGSYRLPPRSLLIKQSERIKNSKNVKPNGSKLMVSSLKDIVSMFQATSEFAEDEEREILEHQNYLRRRIETGELKQLLLDNFALNESTSLMPTNLLVERFPKLNAQGLELIQEAVSMNLNRSWNEIPNYMKQLQFYFAFGSYGPRSDLPFSSMEKPLDFTFKIPSPMAKCGDAEIHELKSSQLTDLRTITNKRSNIFQLGILDPMTKYVLLSALIVSLAAATREWKTQQNPDSKIIILSEGPL